MNARLQRMLTDGRFGQAEDRVGVSRYEAPRREEAKPSNEDDLRIADEELARGIRAALMQDPVIISNFAFPNHREIRVETDQPIENIDEAALKAVKRAILDE